MFDVKRGWLGHVVAAAVLTVAAASHAQDRDRGAGQGKQGFERCREDPAQCRAERRGRAAERFKSADSNGDGALSRSEAQARMPKLAERFEKIDADGNGQVTREELRARAHARRERRRGGRDGQ